MPIVVKTSDGTEISLRKYVRQTANTDEFRQESRERRRTHQNIE